MTSATIKADAPHASNDGPTAEELENTNSVEEWLHRLNALMEALCCVAERGEFAPTSATSVGFLGSWQGRSWPRSRPRSAAT